VRNFELVDISRKCYIELLRTIQQFARIFSEVLYNFFSKIDIRKENLGGEKWVNKKRLQ
jgi:hypothetical protein